MPKALYDQLEELEKQINCFLSPRLKDDGHCKAIKGKSVTRGLDGIKQIEFEGTVCSPTTCKSFTSTPEVSIHKNALANRETTNPTVYTFDISQRLCGCQHPTPPGGPETLSSPAICNCKVKRRSGSASSKRGGKKSIDGTDAELTTEKMEADQVDKRATGEFKSDDKSATEKSQKEKDKKSKGDAKAAAKEAAKQAKEAEKQAAKQAKEAAQRAEEEEQKKLVEENLKKLQEYESLLQEQQAKLKALELQLSEAEKSKKMAISATQELKSKYDKMPKKENPELTKLRKDKDDLEKKIKLEKELKENFEQSSKKNVEKEKKDVKEKTEKVGHQASKSTKSMQKSSAALAKSIQQKDDHIKRLSETTTRLSNSVRDKELENRRLSAARSEMNQSCMEAQMTQKKLADSNAVLQKSIKDFNDKLNYEKSLIKKMQKQIQECRTESQKSADDVARLKQRLQEAIEGPKEIRNAAKLQAKLEESRERERQSKEDAELLQNEMEKAKSGDEEAKKKSEEDFKKLSAEHKKLKEKYDQVTKQLKKMKDDDDKTIQKMRDEYEKFARESEEIEDRLTEERDLLQNSFDNLVENCKNDRAYLENLIALILQHDETLETHKKELEAKEETIAGLQNVLEEVKEKISTLNNEIGGLRSTLMSAEKGLTASQNDMGELRSQLSFTKDKLTLKERAIAQHVAKIKELNSSVTDYQSKFQSASEETRLADTEAQKSQEKIRTLSAQLQKEKASKSTLISEVSGMRSGDGPIKTKAVKVAGLLEKICLCGDDKLIKAYEQKADLLKEEAKLQIKLVEKQKEHAIKTAQYATEKLLETAADFEEQIEMHKRLQIILTKMLQEKESQLQTHPNNKRKGCCCKKILKSSKSDAGTCRCGEYK